MSDESVLRERARQVIEGGMLPNRRPDRMWAGPGGGAACAVCRAPLRPEELEYEIEFDGNGDGRGLETYHVHVHCLPPWMS